MLEVAEKMEMIKKIVSGENDCRRLSHQNLYYFFYLFFLNCHVCTQTRICLGCHGTKKINQTVVQKWNIWCLQYL